MHVWVTARADMVLSLLLGFRRKPQEEVPACLCKVSSVQKPNKPTGEREGGGERWVWATTNVRCCVSHRCHSLKTLPAVPVVCEEWRGKQQVFSCGGSDWEIGADEGTEMSTGTYRDAPLPCLNLASPRPSCLFFFFFFSFPLLHKMLILWHSRCGLPGLLIHLLKAQSCTGAPWDHGAAVGAWHLQTSGSDNQHHLLQFKFWEPSPPNCSFHRLPASSTDAQNPHLLAFTKLNLGLINRSRREGATSEWQPWFQPSCKDLQGSSRGGWLVSQLLSMQPKYMVASPMGKTTLHPTHHHALCCPCRKARQLFLVVASHILPWRGATESPCLPVQLQIVGTARRYAPPFMIVLVLWALTTQ